MIFEWDAAKSVKNARERGLPFDVAMAMFDGPTLEIPDDRRDYGERRIRAIGVVRDVALVCVYSDRSEARRIISLRVANRKERHAYREAFPR
jgi:uncharacterized DUF497 family protein